MVMGSSGDFLPFALVEDILSRLPVESLVRFRCVCKSWLALFQNPIFVSKHLSSSMKRLQGSSHKVLLRLFLHPHFYKLFSLTSMEDAGFSAKEISTPNMSDLKPLLAVCVSNSCDGIMCLYSDPNCGKKIALYNPATKEARFLPSSTISLHGDAVLDVGMGHDPRTNDYKVVRMYTGHGHRHDRNIVEEYSLSTDSWMTISNEKVGYLHLQFYTFSFAMHFGGVYYWWAREGPKETPTVVALNVGGGAYNKVALPSQANICCTLSRLLGVLNDSVSLVCWADSGSFDIWVMDDGFGDKSSWIKLQSINHRPGRPLGFLNNLLVMEKDGVIRPYNIDTEEIQDAEIWPRVGFICEATIYVESLVSVKGRN